MHVHHIIPGTGTVGSLGDGSAATSAMLNGPWRVRSDSLGNLYIGDSGNNRICKVSTTGIITTIAGTKLCSKSISHCRLLSHRRLSLNLILRFS